MNNSQNRKPRLTKRVMNGLIEARALIPWDDLEDMKIYSKSDIQDLQKAADWISDMATYRIKKGEK